MNGIHASLLAFALGLAACAAPPRPRARRPAPAATSAPAPAAAVDAGAAPEDAAPPPSALDRVNAALPGLEVVPAEPSAWLPSRLLGVIAEATGEFPSPTPPTVRGDAVVWGLVAMGHADPARVASACAAVARAEPRVACATDLTEWSGAERARVVLGWRGAAPRVEPTLALPLRALVRLGGAGVCLVSAQRALRTVDLTVRAPSQTELGRLLATVATVPRLSTLVVVRVEPAGGGLEALLSWPLDRADTARADLGDDPWPARCDGASVVGRDVPPRTVPVARLAVTGTRAQGAVVGAAHREWFVTAGDQVAGATVAAVSSAGVTFALGRGRRVVARYPRAR